MADRRSVPLGDGRRRIMRVALAHWGDALKRVASRVQGMGYHPTAAAMRRDRALIEGDDQSQGLVERLSPQQNLLSDPEESPVDGAVALSHDELRLSYYAVRKHRERILDLKRKNEKEEYETEEQEADLAMIGEPRGDDGEPSSGFLADLDLGWEEAELDPAQMDLVEQPAGETPEEEEAAVEEELEDLVMAYCRRRLEENPDLENKVLHQEAQEEFPGSGIGELTLRQFHARYPLQVKRAMAAERRSS